MFLFILGEGGGGGGGSGGAAFRIGARIKSNMVVCFISHHLL